MTTPPLPATLTALPDDAFDYWAAHHLLLRAGFGGTPEVVQGLVELGRDGALDRLLGFEGAAEDPTDSVVSEFSSEIVRPRSREERESIAQARRRGDEQLLERLRRERQQTQRRDRQQMARMREWWIERFAHGTRPFHEKMTLFWHGHFATGYRAVEDSWHMFQQHALFRRMATGNFKDLTHAIIRDPAMLRYLNNNRNVRRSPNENLARELMELFTLGEGNGYGERDIKEGARALTGYSYVDDEFVFRRLQHDRGPKTIFGREGNWDGDDFVDMIFDRPTAAEFLVLKLYRAFVHDLPGDEIDAPRRRYLKSLAAQFRRDGFAVGPLLRTMFRSAHFYHPSNRTARIKSPIELVAGTVHLLGTPLRSVDAAEDALGQMGLELFMPPSVRGWPGGRTWINTSTLFVRQNIAVYLLTGRRPEAYRWPNDRTDYDPMPLLAPLLDGSPTTPDADAAATYLLRHALGRVPHPDRVRAIADFFTDHGGYERRGVLLGALGLIAAMPEYQLC